MESWNDPLEIGIKREVEDVPPFVSCEIIKEEPCEFITQNLLPSIKVEDPLEDKFATGSRDIRDRFPEYLPSYSSLQNTSSPNNLKTVLPPGHTVVKIHRDAQQSRSLIAPRKKTNSSILPGGGKLYNCSMCSKTFNKPNFERHQVIHRPDGEYGCPYCLQVFVRRELFRLHLCVHGLHCPICDQDFITGFSLMKHECNEKWYDCFLCSEKFATNSKLEEHQRVSHYDCGRFTCHLCFVEIFGKSALKDHMDKVHASQSGGMFPCMICFDEFSSQAMLIKHLQVHNIFMMILQTHTTQTEEPSEKNKTVPPCIVRAFTRKRQKSVEWLHGIATP